MLRPHAPQVAGVARQRVEGGALSALGEHRRPQIFKLEEYAALVGVAHETLYPADRDVAPARCHLRHLVNRIGGIEDRRPGGQLEGARTRGLFDLQLAAFIAVRVGQEEREGEVDTRLRSEEHTSELQSLMRISYAVFCLKKKTNKTQNK